MAKLPSPNARHVRLRAALATAALLIACLLAYGCSTLRDPLSVFRSQSPEEETAESERRTALVGDMAVVVNGHWIKAEGYGLVVNLRNTGSDPPVGPVRDYILKEMQVHDVDNPEQLLASKSTAVVVLRGRLRPAIKQGDPFDVEVRAYGNETKSLRGGHLLLAELREMPRLGGIGFKGKLLGYAAGPILVDPTAKLTDNSVDLKQGRILRGGRSAMDRELVMLLKPGHQKFANARRIDAAINQRFAYYDAGIKRGVANAKTPQEIELKVAAAYQDNIPHYVQVLRAIALRVNPNEHVQRMALLEKQLNDDVTAKDAALQLEAIGPESKEILKRALENRSPEVRFFAAEALAYMDDLDAAKPLAELARNEPAFRVYALAALGVMSDFESDEALHDLLNGTSNETRYGAFRALTTRYEHEQYYDERVSGLLLGDKFKFHYHVLDVQGPPLVHVTYNRRPEIVLFGTNHYLKTPIALDAGPHILVRSTRDGQMKVSRFAPDDAGDRSIPCSTNLDEIIRAIVAVGGTYPDVVQALQQAHAQNALTGRFAVDALPEANRFYDRTSSAGDAVDDYTLETKKKTFWQKAGLGWLVPGKEDDSDGSD